MSIFESALNTLASDLLKLAEGTAHNIVSNHKLDFDEICKLKGQHHAMNFTVRMINDALEWIKGNQDATQYPSTNLVMKEEEDKDGNKKVVHVISIEQKPSDNEVAA